MTMDINDPATKLILTNVYAEYEKELYTNSKMYRYYCGVTDVNYKEYSEYGLSSDGVMDSNQVADILGDYYSMNDRNDDKIDVNYVKNFIKQEVSYSVGEKITYISHSGDDDILNALQQNTAHWKESHDNNLCKQMLIYSKCYELYYINKLGQFCAKIIDPRHGFAYIDDEENVIFFLHIHYAQFDMTTLLVDIYTDSEIIHCDNDFNELSTRDSTLFGEVPVSPVDLSEEGWLDTVYHDIKTLNDAYCRNIGDESSEISEFRNAYLVTNNFQIDPKDITNMKKLGIIQTETPTGSAQAGASFLVKNVNDTFMQNVLANLKDDMYEISSHINPNEKTQSNTSGISIRSRYMALEQKCKLNENALADTIKNRTKFLFIYLNGLKNTTYNYLDVLATFTPCIPTDITAISNMIHILGDKLSLKTALGQLPFIPVPDEEIALIQGELEANAVGASLLDPAVVRETLTGDPLATVKPTVSAIAPIKVTAPVSTVAPVAK